MKTTEHGALARSEIAVITRAASRAPSVHNIQPWRLRVRGADIDLIERTSVELPVHDPENRDRMLSCGAALANLQIAVEVLCRTATVHFPENRDVAATVRTAPGGVPSNEILAQYHAIGRRRSHREWFAAKPVSTVDTAALAAAGAEPKVRVLVPQHRDALAEMLGFATRVFRADLRYQRELDSWTVRPDRANALGTQEGMLESTFGPESLPAAGLVRRGTPVPDDSRLAERLASENLFVFCTPTDGSLDHLAAGTAMERTWLAATARGLAGSVLTQPLHLAGFRRDLAERLELPWVPQAIFPTDIPRHHLRRRLGSRWTISSSTTPSVVRHDRQRD